MSLITWSRRLIRRRIVARAIAETSDNRSSDEMLPPKILRDLVGGGFETVGPEFSGYFLDLCNLKPHEHVLDIGCGSGRMALPLTKYLNPDGRYDGFDVSPDAINWCQRRITTRFPQFTFQSLDIRNGPYNPGGKIEPSKLVFPYEDSTFDFVFLASIFTHMLPSGVDRYVREIARVLKPGGRCLMTFFLLNDESIELMDVRKGEYHFKHKGPGYRTINARRPEEAIAFPEAVITDLIERCGLEVNGPLRYGSWCGRKEYLSFQDIVVAVKPAQNDVVG